VRSTAEEYLESITGKRTKVNLQKVHKILKVFNDHMKNKAIDIDLRDINQKSMAEPDSIPEYTFIKTKDGSQFEFLPKRDHNGQILTPVVSVGGSFQYLGIPSDTASGVASGNLGKDMGGYVEIQGNTRNKYVAASRIRINSKEDVALVADNINKAIAPFIPKLSKSINMMTMKKIAYTLIQAFFFQGGFQLSSFGNIASDQQTLKYIESRGVEVVLNINPPTGNDEYLSYLHIHVDNDGNAEITITTLARVGVQFPDGKSELKEKMGVQTVLKVNICEKTNPTFTMTQRAEFKEVPDLRPEYFFNEQPKPKPRLFSSIRG
jgi:hypothetical protein